MILIFILTLLCLVYSFYFLFVFIFDLPPELAVFVIVLGFVYGTVMTFFTKKKSR